MSSTVIDFFHGGGGEKPYQGYILRLRANDERGIYDLCNNTVINHNVTYSTSSPYGGGGNKALTFNGNDAYISLQNSGCFSKNQDFTITFWVLDQPLSNYWRADLFFRSRDCLIEVHRQNQSDYYHRINFESYHYDLKMTIPSRPYHYALVRHNGEIKKYFNGQSVDTFTNINEVNLSDITIGYYSDTGAPYKYAWFTLDDYCVIAGKALWTENFTPPTTYLPDYNDL